MKLRIFYLLLLLLPGINYAQEIDVKSGNQRIERFINEQGFYQNTVTAITTDSKGYIWIASPNGLVRYDGYSFEYFYHNPDNKESIPNNYVTHLLNDSYGRLWIGTKQGLCLYSADKESFLRINESLKNVTFIKEDTQKRVWVGKGSRLHIFNSGSDPLGTINKAREINLDAALNGNNIIDIEFLSDTELLVATTFKVYKITIKEVANYSIDVSSIQFDIDENEIRKIIKIKNSIWLGTNSGIYQTFYEDNRLIKIDTYFESIKEKCNKQAKILSIYQDKENNVWIGTEQNGVLKYDSKNAKFVAFEYDSKNDNGLSSSRINCFYEDSFGVIWIGTAQGGLNKLDKNQKPFHNYSHNPYDDHSLSGNLITDITEDLEGRIWISFFGNTICRTRHKLDLNASKPIIFDRLENQLSLLKDQWVLRLFQDTKGFWWIGTNKRLYLYDEKNEVLRRVQLKIGNELIDPDSNRIINQIGSEDILLGGSKVFLLNNPWSYILKNEPVKVEKQLLDLGEGNTINEYIKDGFGNHWFGSTDGIYRLVNEEGELRVKNHITTFSETDKLLLDHNNIFTIHINKNKDIWLGSFGGGLMKIQLNSVGVPEGIKSYHKKDGLPDEGIYGILEDEKGKLWLSTDMGICRFDPLIEKFDVFDVNDGLINNNFRQSAHIKLKNGTMLMGGLNGLTIFDPEQIVPNEITPKMSIAGLKINNQPIMAGKEYNGRIILDKSIADTEKLVLDDSSRNISLDIIVKHSSAPKKNKIAYMLEGVNKDWIEIDGGKTTATYTNLSSNTYKFMYKGVSGDGIWTEGTSEFIIQVLSPWYLRWWSLTLWIIIALIIPLAISAYLVRLEKLKQELNFEQLDKERVHEMDQAKLKFFTNVSHDFKTPLSLIMGPLEKITEQIKGSENQKYFSIIQNNIGRLQRLIDQLIAYRKAETGHLELSYSKSTIGNFMYPLMETFEDYTQRVGVNFYYKVNSPNKHIVLDVNKTERILLNLFSNAVKYDDLNREVNIESGIRSDDDKEIFYIEVSNTGIGITEDKMDKLFDRFYSGAQDMGNWGGSGIGLAMCKSLIELMEGTILVSSTPGQKTAFKIELPLDKSLYVEEIVNLEKQRKIITDWLPIEIVGDQERSSDGLRPDLLIIDDEKDVRNFLQEVFKNNYNVTLAADGEDGLRKLKEKPPQLVISDVMMPKLNGYELCEQIKSNLEYCNIPVVLLTALDDDTKKTEGFELGADAYITKPFSIKQLEVRVKKLIENKQRIFEYFSVNSVLPETNEPIKISKRDQDFLEKITVSIEKNMESSTFGVEELAVEVGMSTSNFYRRLKQLTGQVPNSYLRNFRFQKAAELLKENPDLTATEVMYDIGIESTSYYSTSFKKLHGYSPSEFVKRIKG